MPTGDPNCPPYIRDDKQIFYKIVQATDGLTGGSDVDGDFGETRTKRDDKSVDEEDDDEFNNNDEDDYIGIILPNHAALLPHLGDTISGNNSFSTDKQECASVCGGSCLDTESARGVSHSNTASAQGVSYSDTTSAQGGSSSESLRKGGSGDWCSFKGEGRRRAEKHSFKGGGWGGGRKRVALLHNHSRPHKSHEKTMTVGITASCFRM